MMKKSICERAIMKLEFTKAICAGLLLSCSASALAAVSMASSFYQYAHKSDMRSIQILLQKGFSLEMTNSQGMTPVCEAVANKDENALNILINMGASPRPACLQAFSPALLKEMSLDVAEGSVAATPKKEIYRPVIYANNSGTAVSSSSSISPWVWGGIGAAALVGGGIALASSGGGGGGGSHPSACGGHGTMVDGVCQCNSGYLPSEDGQTCVQKEADVVLKNSSDLNILESEVIGTYLYSNATATKSDVTGPVDVYGIKNDTNKNIANLLQFVATKSTTTSGTTTYSVDASKSVTPTGEISLILSDLLNTGNAYGIYTDGNLAFNTFVHGEKQDISGTVSVSKGKAGSGISFGDVYGIYTSRDSGMAINVYGVLSSTQAKALKSDLDKSVGHIATGKITLSGVQTKNATYAALWGGDNGLAVNSLTGLGTSEYASYATGSINIRHSGSGTLYGARAKYSYNAAVVPSLVNSNLRGKNTTSESTSSPYGDSVGRITINNAGGRTDIYGLYGSAIAYNAFKDILKGTNPDGSTFIRTTTPWVGRPDGYIDIMNTGDGDIYGIYGAKVANLHDLASTYFSSTETGSLANISITSQGNGNVYGMYGTTSTSGNAIITSSVGYDKVGDKAGNVTAVVTVGTDDSPITGTGKVYGMHLTGGQDHNAYASIGENGGKQAVTAQVAVSHKTPKKASSGTDVYGFYTAGGENVLAKISSNNKQATITGTINISEKNESEHATNVYGVYSKTNFSNAHLTEAITGSTKSVLATVIADVSVSNNSANDEAYTYGIYAPKHTVYNAQATSVQSAATTTSVNGSVAIVGTSGTVIGIEGSTVYNAYNNTTAIKKAEGTIAVTSAGKEVCAMKGDELYNAAGTGAATGKIDLTYKGISGNAYGMYGSKIVSPSGSTITLTLKDVADSKARTIVGMYGTSGSTITNAGSITITGETKKTIDTAFGIYSEGKGGTITNSGTITISGVGTAYGIYVADGTSTTVVNTGTIKLDDVACSGDCSGATTNGKYIVLNGGVLINSGLISSTSLNSLSLGGTLTAAKGAQFNIKNNMSGPLGLSADLTTQGFDTTYVAKDMINAGDTSKLQLKSESALFDASLRGSDVVMRMKSFDSVTDNTSFAKFLAKNYASANNEEFFNKLKRIGSVSALTNGLNQMMGKEMLSRFSFEDMTMMRELNFDMNNNLFNNKESYFSMAGEVSFPMAFRGDKASSSRYSLTNKSNGIWSVGFGVAFTDIHSDRNDNERLDSAYQMIVPIGYKASGFKFVTSPRLGYARGNYDRTGFEDKSYDGTIEKRIFGLMNEARYPMAFGTWKLEPALEFNILGYEQKGREDIKEFSLNIPKQRTYSVESGAGLYMTHETELSKDSTLKMTAGVVAYHEFADPYKIDIGMNGMDGTFTLRDEKRTDNRAVARAGVNYDTKAYGVAASVVSYIDRETETKASLDFKWKF